MVNYYFPYLEVFKERITHSADTWFGSSSFICRVLLGQQYRTRRIIRNV